MRHAWRQPSPWRRCMTQAGPADRAAVATCADSVAISDLAMIVYTSGTTGNAEGDAHSCRRAPLYPALRDLGDQRFATCRCTTCRCSISMRSGSSPYRPWLSVRRRS